VADQPKPISLFYSYSHRDEDLRLTLQRHLSALRRAGLIAEWHDRNIEAGDEWAREIDRNLATADIILLLISADFIDSDYCWSVETKKALARHDRGEAVVIPVILRPCRWGITPFAKLQSAPKDARPVTQWPDPDAAFDDVAAKIERVVLALRQRRMPAEAAAATASPPTAVEAEPVRSRPDDWPDFEVFRDIDASWCPELVVIPAGSFLMGSPADETERMESEGPQHRVTIGHRFGLGRYPLTVGQYGKFVEATGRRHEGGLHVWTGKDWKMDAGKSWRDPGFAQEDRHPVVGVSWRDAIAYCEWLTKETGQRYRLPSEAEWEYACRAGTETPFSFGATITTDQANYDGNYTYGAGRKGSYRERTTEVGTFPANPWGLYDLHGNVWEWVEDVWHDTYQGAPADGSAWTDGKGKESSRARVLRGGSWGGNPRFLRSARRYGDGPDLRGDDNGFRVARTLLGP
jgi:formylglycine-generating enzyme required for sulfatase activity